jgi:hypothetical protein
MYFDRDFLLFLGSHSCQHRNDLTAHANNWLAPSVFQSWWEQPFSLLFIVRHHPKHCSEEEAIGLRLTVFEGHFTKDEKLTAKSVLLVGFRVFTNSGSVVTMFIAN